MPVTDPAPKKFVWPPKPPAPHLPDRAPVTRSTSTPALPHVSVWQAIEETWLDVTTPPIERELEAAGIAPDAGDEYCWRCGHGVGPYEVDAKGCARCRPMRLRWNHLVRLGSYRGAWRTAVTNLKFGKLRASGPVLGRMLGRRVTMRLSDLGIDPRDVIVVPVPTSFWRRITRGVDHPTLIARGVARELGAPVYPCLRRSHRPAQITLSATARRVNVRGSMAPAWRLPLDRALSSAPFMSHLGPWRLLSQGLRSGSLTIVLVDDVTTTGATLVEAARAVREVGKLLRIKDLRIIAAVVAVTDRRRKLPEKPDSPPTGEPGWGG